MTEFKLSYTASDINERLGRIDNLAKKSELPTKTSDLINDSNFVTENYVQDYVQSKSDYTDICDRIDSLELNAAVVNDTLSKKANNSGWSSNKYLGTDENGNIVEKDAPDNTTATVYNEVLFIPTLFTASVSGETLMI